MQENTDWHDDTDLAARSALTPSVQSTDYAWDLLDDTAGVSAGEFEVASAGTESTGLDFDLFS